MKGKDTNQDATEVGEKDNNQDGLKYEAVVRSMISREDDLFNHRMSWLAAFNGLLFAALSFSWNKPGARPLTILFCILGFLISALHAGGIEGSGVAQRRLLLWWREKEPLNYDGPGVMGLKPFDEKARSLWFTPWFLSAILLAIAWLVIFFYILWLDPICSHSVQA